METNLKGLDFAPNILLVQFKGPMTSLNDVMGVCGFWNGCEKDVCVCILPYSSDIGIARDTCFLDEIEIS